ncbi:unknown protein [Seminavis robusta]|uniref:Uncharacterized protein n=1 Tax=Seminavis robusta TaxID=568900 RepID=A0A9N8HZV3_9STRA|nr:unknown protein [Seminavis robusta]|eukprot:Sro3170_g344730.1 n/a (288) ;mRNA; r:49-912
MGFQDHLWVAGHPKEQSRQTPTTPKDTAKPLEGISSSSSSDSDDKDLGSPEGEDSKCGELQRHCQDLEKARKERVKREKEATKQERKTSKKGDSTKAQKKPPKKTGTPKKTKQKLPKSPCKEVKQKKPPEKPKPKPKKGKPKKKVSDTKTAGVAEPSRKRRTEVSKSARRRSTATQEWSYHKMLKAGEDFYCHNHNCRARIALMDPFFTHRRPPNENGEDQEVLHYHTGWYCLGIPVTDREGFLAADFGDGRGASVQNMCEDFWKLEEKQRMDQKSGRADEAHGEAD